jgi:CHAD domain-containing protein
MADAKWLVGLGPEMDVAEAARQVFEVRLRLVRSHLPLASSASEADRDTEHVHQLRVATRRAGAALRIFQRCLPDRIHRKLKKTLRAIRRAAGDARDWDVFDAELLRRRREGTSALAAREGAGLDFLVGYAAGQRDAAQIPLTRAGEKYGPRLKELIDDTLRDLRGPGGAAERTLGDLGRALVHDLIRELEFAAGQDLEDYGHLHQVRILGKQLRYTMEVFAGCFPSAFREELYPRVEDMQGILGKANDSHVASVRLADLRERLRVKWPDDWKRYQAGLDGLLRYHRRRLPRERERFLQWWKQWQTDDSRRLRELIGVPLA